MDTNSVKTYEIHFNHSYTHSYTYVKACSEEEAVSKFHKVYPKRYYRITDVWEVKD